MTRVTTEVKLQKWGNSKGIRLTQDILAKLNIADETDVQFGISFVQNSIVLTPVGETSPLAQLLDKYEEEQKPIQYKYGTLKVTYNRFGEHVTFAGQEYYDVMSALHELGKKGWELAIKEDKETYILKKQIRS